MTKRFNPLWFLGVACCAPALAQIYPESLPANQGAATVYSDRNIALGELRFSDPALYNLYDQGGSALGLLDTHNEKLRLQLGLLNSDRSSGGDSLQIGEHDYYLPQVGFFQPGVFAAILYYQRQTESYQNAFGSDSLDLGTSQFGLDLAAGPASGLFRIGFSAHGLVGDMDYPGPDHRVLLGVPSLRLDAGSKPVPGVEVGVFGGVSGRFDSLESDNGSLERVASMTLPSYGVLAGIDSVHGIPVLGNTVLEFGTHRTFGEYRQENQPGNEYNIIWTGFWTLQTQWMYAVDWNDFQLQPSLRYAHRSDDAQGYVGIKGNQNPFNKGAKIDGLDWTEDVNDFGLGGRITYREITSLSFEWETSGHTLAADTTSDQSYTRFSLGMENHLERIAALKIPAGMSLAVRAGWTWRQEALGSPGYEDFQFNPFVPTSQVSDRMGFTIPTLAKPAAYSSIHLGLGLGLLDHRLEVDALLSFPGERELELMNQTIANQTTEVSGLEFGATAAYRIF